MGREWYSGYGRCHTHLGEDGMSFIIAIMSVPLLIGTGIYNPKVVHKGYCIADPGGFHALFCPPDAKPHPRYRKKS